jgi:two-component system, LytTR family, sensor kinase
MEWTSASATVYIRHTGTWRLLYEVRARPAAGLFIDAFGGLTRRPGVTGGCAMLTPSAPPLLHIVGFLTGIVLYAMLLAMVVRAQPAGDRVTVFTALMGLAWNVGEMCAIACRGLGLLHVELWTTAASYTALGFLGAVVVHSVARGPTLTGHARLVRGAIVGLAYAGAGTAGAMQLWAAATGDSLPSSAALTLQTGSVVVLAPVLLAVTGAQATDRRALWMIALAVFAVSAVHLGQFHGANESWAAELVGHHASIPLAFAILYQDYRFALADLFLKQALTLIALVALVFGTWSVLSAPMTHGAPSSFAVGSLLACWAATALAFPWIRSGIRMFVDRVVLRRSDYVTLIEEVGAELQSCDNERDALERTCRALTPALSANAVSWQTVGDEPTRLSAREVVVPTADVPQYVLSVGMLAGGRRLLSDDIVMLDRVTLMLARRIDAIRLTEERYERALHEQEMHMLATEAELRALRAQINPHFLFNALTTMGYLIQTAPPRALHTLLRLTSLLRTVLRSEGELTTLGRERDLIDDYLSIERERFEERLHVTLDVPEQLLDVQMPSLIVQPLVENAIKHGIAGARSGGSVVVQARSELATGHSELVVQVRNTGAVLASPAAGAGSGVGLRNVQRRLWHYYEADASLRLFSDATGATIAELRLPICARERTVAARGGRAT